MRVGQSAWLIEAESQRSSVNVNRRARQVAGVLRAGGRFFLRAVNFTGTPNPPGAAAVHRSPSVVEGAGAH